MRSNSGAEQHDLPGRGQVRDVALEVPLGALALGRLLQRHHPRPARVEVLHEPLDRAALARRVAPLEQDDDAGAGVLHPVLQLQQLDLQQPLGLLVLRAGEPLVVRVALAPGVDRGAVGPEEHGVVVVGVVDGQAGGVGEQRGKVHPPTLHAVRVRQGNGR
jgi:hypothetical protein